MGRHLCRGQRPRQPWWRCERESGVRARWDRACSAQVQVAPLQHRGGKAYQEGLTLTTYCTSGVAQRSGGGFAMSCPSQAARVVPLLRILRLLKMARMLRVLRLGRISARLAAAGNRSVCLGWRSACVQVRWQATRWQRLALNFTRLQSNIHHVVAGKLCTLYHGRTATDTQWGMLLTPTTPQARRAAGAECGRRVADTARVGVRLVLRRCCPQRRPHGHMGREGG